MEHQQSAVGSGTHQLVVFKLAGESYGVDIYQVREIIRVPEITKVPQTPDFVEGIINLRGGVIPVLDLRRRLGMGAQDASRDARIVIVELGDQRVGMLVDGVSEVLRIGAEQIEPPSPYIMNADAQFVTGIARLQDALILVLDIHRLLNPAEQQEMKDLVEAVAPAG
ncbi:MAG: chemotaxis protein CheW [Limnochordales bacterium]|nr:chemotaxis protein CheW [Limnochordales bacterium]